MRRLWEQLEHLPNIRLFAIAFAWVVAGGLLLQLLVLPYLVPHAHWGHGLIAEQDSIGFHRAALDIAAAVEAGGWSAWWYAEKNMSIAVASALYVIAFAEPWVVLPVNGVLFGITIVAVREALGVTFRSRAIGVIALLPFFIFPSFVPIWGQLHRDLYTGTGLALVLCGLVLGARRDPPVRLLHCCAIALAGMVLLGVSRSYALTIVAAATLMFTAVAMMSRQTDRVRLCAVVGVVMLASASSVADWSNRFTPSQQAVAGRMAGGGALSADISERPSLRPRVAGSAAPPRTPPPLPGLAPRGWRPPGVRAVDPTAPRPNNCLPPPSPDLVDRLLFNLCYVREGFVADSLRVGAGSGFDFDVRLRTVKDFLAYSPRALQVALLEPGPTWWMRQTTPIGRLATYVVPFEMTIAYLCFGLAAVFAYRRLARFEVCAPLVFCATYAIVYVVATSQMGTFYRMRAFAFAIMVSTALAAVVDRVYAARAVAGLSPHSAP